MKEYTKEEAINEMLKFRDKWDYDLIDCPDYERIILKILRETDDGEEY